MIFLIVGVLYFLIASATTLKLIISEAYLVAKHNTPEEVEAWDAWNKLSGRAWIAAKAEWETSTYRHQHYQKSMTGIVEPPRPLETTPFQSVLVGISWPVTLPYLAAKHAGTNKAHNEIKAEQALTESINILRANSQNDPSTLKMLDSIESSAAKGLLEL